MMKGEEVDVDMVDVDENVTLDSASEDLKEARRLNKLAISYHDQGKFAKAKSTLESALTIGEKIPESKKHPEIATWLCNLGSVLLDMGDLEEALKLHLRALQIDGQFHGLNDAHVAAHFGNIAKTLEAMRKYDKARIWIEKAIEIDKEFLGTDHPDAATRLSILASIYKAKGIYGDAAYNYQRALEIYTNHYGRDHPDVATARSNLISLLQVQDKNDEAEEILRSALRLLESDHGPDHTAVATALNNLASLLFSQGKLDEAAQHCERALNIRLRSLGEEHPVVAESLNARGLLFEAEGMHDEAKATYERAISISQQHYPHDHPFRKTLQSNLRNLRQDEDQEEDPGFSTKEIEAVTKEEARELYEIVLYGDDKKRGPIRRLRTLLDKIEGKSKYVLIKFFLAGHGDIEIPSPLFITCALGKIEMTLKLVHCNFSLNQTDANGHTPIHYAAAYDQINILEKMWEYHMEKFEWTAFRARDNAGRDAVKVREEVYEGTLKVLLCDLIAKFQDGGAILDKDELEKKKKKTIEFFRDTWGLLDAGTQTSPTPTNEKHQKHAIIDSESTQVHEITRNTTSTASDDLCKSAR